MQDKILQLKKKHNIENGKGLHYEYVKDYIDLFGYTLIDKLYEGQHKKLDIKCNDCDSISNISLKSFFRRMLKSSKCKTCIGLELKLDWNVVLNEAKKRGHTVLSDSSDYKLAKSKLRFKCENNHIFMATWDKYSTNPKRSHRSNGCGECGRLKNSLSGAYNYKGNKSVRLWIREHLQEWKRRSLLEHGNKCFITDKSGDVIIHHATNFDLIFSNELNRLELPSNITIGEYTEKQLFKLEKAIHKAHIETGVPMLKKIHIQFHMIYGKTNNTMTQVLEFKNNYILGVL